MGGQRPFSYLGRAYRHNRKLPLGHAAPNGREAGVIPRGACKQGEPATDGVGVSREKLAWLRRA